MPGTLVSDASAPVLWNNTEVTASVTDIIDDVEVGYPGWVAIQIAFGTCDFTTGDEEIIIEIEGSDDGTTYYPIAATKQTAADASDTTLWLRCYLPYRYAQLNAVVEGTSPSFYATVTVEEDMYMQTKGQSA